MADGRSALDRLLREELARPAPSAAKTLVDALHARHPKGIAAVLFYGSCLRRDSAEGVLDFYVLADDYARFYPQLRLRFLNRALPPNVFYLEADAADPGAETLRCKYAVMTLDDFARATGAASVRPAIWARFCQPALAVWTKDETSLGAAARACAEAVRTAVRRTLPLLTEDPGPQRFSRETFWQRLFQETYGSELRTEKTETIEGLYRDDPSRYDRVLDAALASLQEEGELEVRPLADALQVDSRPGALRRARRDRSWRRPLARVLAVVQLLKSAFTFGDWLPYALFKLERHTGTRLELTPRQRRHPFLYAWPLIFRVLRQREVGMGGSSDSR